MMTMSYDKFADVLYVMFEPAAPDSYFFLENAEGDVLKVDRVSRRVVGCTILSFALRTKQGKPLVVPPERFEGKVESQDRSKDCRVALRVNRR
jgi:hypothetical protein